MNRRTEWHPAALCAASDLDPDLWYAEGDGPREEAKKVCRQCPVREACLRDSLDYREQYGVWGGVDERERAAMRREQGLASGPVAYSASDVNALLGLLKPESLERRRQRAARLERTA